jgi:RNA polymerase sigma-70 factor (ECF subfamily)
MGVALHLPEELAPLAPGALPRSGAASRTHGGARILAFGDRRNPAARVSVLTVDSWSDEDLVRAALREGERAGDYLDPLFRRYQTRVASWCLRVCGRREEAADLAQEVFLRVHERLAQFRFESSFATWLYLVTRTVAINRSISNRRRDAESIDEEGFLEPVDPRPGVDEEVHRRALAAALESAIASELEPLEARVLHLHFRDELPLAAIDSLLGLDNRSGAKAYIVSAKRKLKRHFSDSGAAARESKGASS